MPIFDAKRRSWEAYLAGIGASGALMASASVMFVILVGVVTFSAWPHAGSPVGGVAGGGDAALHQIAKPAPATAQPSTLNLVRLLGRGAAPAPSRRSGIRGESGGIGHDLSPGHAGGPSGGSGDLGGQPQGAQQPPSTPTQPRNAVSQAVSNAGNTVQSDTDSLGNTLGGNSGPGLGGVVGGLGRTLNTDLQSVAGGP
jgi:hypothetical protein